MSSPISTVVAVSGLVACALFAASQGPSQENPAAAANADNARAYEQGMMVVRDAESGTLRAATPAEAARYSQRATPKAGGAVAIRRADGSISARLDESHMMFSTVTRRADGTWERQCGMNHDHSVHAAAPAREVK